MPSLNALGQFKDSFNNIANEKADVESLSLPFESLPLPKKEAPPFEYSRQENASDSSSAAAAEGEEFDVNKFLNELPGGNDSPPVDLPPSDDMSSDEAASALGGFLNDLTSSPPQVNEEEDQIENTSLPDDLLAGFSDEMESASADFPAEETIEDTAEDFDADSLADDIPALDELSSPADGESALDETPLEDFDLPSVDETPLEDFNVPDSFETPAAEPDMPVFDELPSDDSFDLPASEELPSEETFNMPASIPEEDEEEEIGGFDLGGESPYVEESSATTEPEAEETSPVSDEQLLEEQAPATEDFDMSALTDDFGSDDFNAADSGSEETPADDFNIPELGDDSGFDLGGEESALPSGDSGGDFSSDELPDMDFPGGDFDTPLSDDTFGNDSPASMDFGDTDLSSDFGSDSIDLNNEPAAQHESHDSGFSSSNSDFGNDDFDIPDLDNILNKSAPPAPKPQPKKGLFGRKKEKDEGEAPPAEDDVEEISLNQDDVDSLLRTLSLYPLNLRIHCEELIAEQVILPQQLSKLIRLLVNGASVKETAAHVESITGKPVIIPRSFEKGTGAAFEAEQSSFAYIFVHNFLPVLKIFAFIAVLAASVFYLSYKFIYTPLKAESLYKRGYERIPAGEYQRANELFHEAFMLHRKKKWFYSYAEAFRDQRRLLYAENKYDELLRYYPRDKKGVLDYANLNTYYILNYDKANRLLQRELLDFQPDDFDGLLAAGDNFMAWADSDPSRFSDRYEDARFSYARLLEKYGWLVPVVERMMTYFIRTDNLKEVLNLRVWFENDPKRRVLSPPSLTELAGYLLDKQLEKPKGVPNPYVESIESVRAMLLQAIGKDPYLPEAHYHLARYHKNLNNTYEERLTLENAIRAFDLAKQEPARRRLYRSDTHYRYANLLINNREFFPADEQLVKGIELFEDFMNRNLIPASPQLGQMYSLRGDLEYFVKSGDMEAALRNYHLAERYGYSPPEIKYRIGAAYYQREDWRNALDYMFKASAELPLNRRLLFALGNVTFNRGDYYAANGYYGRLLDMLEVQRLRLPVLLPNDNAQFLETGERLMMARNNAGVVNEALADQTGNRNYRSRAMALYAESSSAWSAITRNPETMTRMRLTDSPGAPSINLGYLNANNALRSNSGYKPQIFVRIDRDVLEPSKWEELAPLGGL